MECIFCKIVKGEAPCHKIWEVDKYFDKYEGYISSHDYKRAKDDKLTRLAKKIRGG